MVESVIHMSSYHNSYKCNNILVRGLENVELFDFDINNLLRNKGGRETI